MGITLYKLISNINMLYTIAISKSRKPEPIGLGNKKFRIRKK